MRISVILIALAFTVIATGTVKSESLLGKFTDESNGRVLQLDQVAEAEKWRDMTEEELRKRYSNRTLTFTSRRTDNIIKVYYKADGTFEGTCCAYNWNSQWDGKWRVKGSEVCFETTSGRRAGQTTCVNIVTNGKETKRKDGKSATKNRSWEDGNKMP